MNYDDQMIETCQSQFEFNVLYNEALYRFRIYMYKKILQTIYDRFSNQLLCTVLAFLISLLDHSIKG